MSSESREWSEPLRISADHPSLPGHFPGQPVVAGVILLDHLAAAVEARNLGSIHAFGTVKFRAPLLPEQDATLHARIEGSRLRFRIQRADQVLVEGDAKLS